MAKLKYPLCPGSRRIFRADFFLRNRLINRDDEPTYRILCPICAGVITVSKGKLRLRPHRAQLPLNEIFEEEVTDA